MAQQRKRKRSVKKPAQGSKPSAETSSAFDWLESVELTHGSLAGIKAPISESKYMDLDWHEQIELAAMDRSRHGGPPKAKLLTPSEIQVLRQRAKETSVFARKAFAHLRPKKA